MCGTNANNFFGFLLSVMLQSIDIIICFQRTRIKKRILCYSSHFKNVKFVITIKRIESRHVCKIKNILFIDTFIGYNLCQIFAPGSNMYFINDVRCELPSEKTVPKMTTAIMVLKTIICSKSIGTLLQLQVVERKLQQLETMYVPSLTINLRNIRCI